MGIREEQKEKRRNEILSAGLDLFIHKGYSATKISDIARRVGMSVGLLFHYFESKERLYEELIRIGVSGPMQTMAPTEKEPLVFFEETAERLFQYISTQPFFSKMFVLMFQAISNDAAPQGIKDLLKSLDVYTPTARLIRRGQENGTIREGDPVALSIAYWCAIEGIAEQLALSPDLPCPESSWIVDILRRQP